MKAIKCEMCGSTDFAKQDGMFVCQHCHTKYTVEDAQKIMVEIDDSKKLPNLYERARKSLEVNDLTHAAEYYKQILDIDPNDWEAYFYSYLGEFTSYSNAEASAVAAKLGNTLPPAYDMAIKGCSTEEATARVRTITIQSVARISAIMSGGYAVIKQYERGNILTPAGKVNNDLYHKMRPLVMSIVVACIDSLKIIDAKLSTLEAAGIAPEVVKECSLIVRKNIFEIANHVYYQTDVMIDRMIKREFIMKYAQNVIDLGGFGTCKGEETVVFQMDKTKAILVPSDGKKAGGGKGKVVITNYKCTYDTGKPKKDFEKSLATLFEVGGDLFNVFLYFTDGSYIKLQDLRAAQDCVTIKNKLGI